LLFIFNLINYASGSAAAASVASSAGFSAFAAFFFGAGFTSTASSSVASTSVVTSSVVASVAFFLAPPLLRVFLAGSAAYDAVLPYTSLKSTNSIIAISALSPTRAPNLMMRV
jgi:hypothetical protein